MTRNMLTVKFNFQDILCRNPPRTNLEACCLIIDYVQIFMSNINIQYTLSDRSPNIKVCIFVNRTYDMLLISCRLQNS